MKSNDKLSVCLVLVWTANLFVGCDETQPANDGLLMLSYDSGIAQTPDAQAIVDLGNVPDQGVDASPEPVILDAPEARVYANDPVTDDGQLSDVTLTRSIHEEGRLTSPWVEVFNCINEDGGAMAMPNVGGFNLTIQLCNEVQAAKPDDQGHFLSIEPPEDDSDPNDQFAELMMYHHSIWLMTTSKIRMGSRNSIIHCQLSSMSKLKWTHPFHF